MITETRGAQRSTAMTCKRELIARDGEQHCVRRDAETGQFREWDKVSRTFPGDPRRHHLERTIR